MIAIHEENHLGVECKKLSKESLRTAVFVTIEEFEEQEESGYFQHHDCSGQWACISLDGMKYAGNSVASKKPYWATHVYWWSK